MFRTVLSLVFAASILSGCATLHPKAGKSFTIAENGVVKTCIVVAPDAPASTQHAAQELQRFLGEITGAQIPILPDTGKIQRGEIIVGENKHFKAVARGKIDLKSLGREGYVVKTLRGHLLIAGGEPRGTLYGVYGLLEDHLGCHWFTAKVNRIPKQATLSVGPLDDRVVPTLEYREPFVMDCFDGDWAARNRMNSSTARLEDKHGGKVTYFGFVHTFEGLVPPAKYFATHPEYYSLINGKRVGERSQLCCTNEEVIQIVIEEVRKRMREHPECTVFSVSQNDWHNYCECDKCTALADSEGTQMAPVLALVNRVAEVVAKEFPDKVIDTLAYQYTRKAPKAMRPAPNVIVRLCSIECCFAHSFEKCDSEENVSFVKDVQDWGKVCNRLWVWNYDTSFSNYFTPYPNLRVRKDNINFYIRNGVRGIFEQDVYTTLNGEFSELSGYLNAKLLWNPAYDTDTAINEFLDAVYGKAAKPVRAYLDLIHDKVEKENLHMDIWIGPDHPLLGGGVLEKAETLFDEAEKCVADNPEVLERVRAARLSVDFAAIEHAREEGLKVYTINHETRSLTVRPDFQARVQRFLETAARNNVTQLRENNGAIALYKKELEAYGTISAGPLHKAVNKPASLKPGLKFARYDGAWDSLPDFAKLKPAVQGVAEQISLDAANRAEPMALMFTGYFLAPADGLYLFHCRSNDGSKLFVAGEELFDNDGLHKMTLKTGIVALKKGYHPFKVQYFDAGGKRGLEVYCEGPGVEKQIIPANSLWH